ncbi:hypothetical protein CTAM01_04986 [Colletotrichum tamarilloi]|uniref:Uncharacterized protein n=1 Tax=Colletotrichum tamarilloi TaxID=1209934 RepID=A0ABQ9RGC4_9PEZI|nr:uncharacterized protein CTAM01_04986 [Colletotrichum tamarilloi]KAK1502997.1 hypothetical protein CTAM01_04986 [Colletotrichum tamarilloi]
MNRLMRQAVLPPDSATTKLASQAFKDVLVVSHRHRDEGTAVTSHARRLPEAPPMVAAGLHFRSGTTSPPAASPGESSPMPSRRAGLLPGQACQPLSVSLSRVPPFGERSRLLHSPVSNL